MAPFAVKEEKAQDRCKKQKENRASRLDGQRSRPLRGIREIKNGTHP